MLVLIAMFSEPNTKTISVQNCFMSRGAFVEITCTDDEVKSVIVNHSQSLTKELNTGGKNTALTVKCHI